MKRISLIAVLVGTAILGASVPLFGESTSVLLEKGIYLEETMGDLDKAMDIYQEIINEHKENRSYAAEAWQRLGLCLLKQGKKDKATQIFQELAINFPDQEEIIAKVKPYIPQKPKTESECAKLRDQAIQKGDIIAACDAEMQRVLLRKENKHAYKDKISLDSVWEKFVEKHKPSNEKMQELINRVLEYSDKHESDVEYLWRSNHMLAHMCLAMEMKDEAAMYFEETLASYPDVEYRLPSKFSKFHHIVHQRAELIWDEKGIKEAFDYFLDKLKNDPRCEYFFNYWWQKELQKRNQIQFYRDFLLRVREAYQVRKENFPEKHLLIDQYLRELGKEIQNIGAEKETAPSGKKISKKPSNGFSSDVWEIVSHLDSSVESVNQAAENKDLGTMTEVFNQINEYCDDLQGKNQDPAPTAGDWGDISTETYDSLLSILSEMGNSAEGLTSITRDRDLKDSRREDALRMVWQSQFMSKYNSFRELTTKIKTDLAFNRISEWALPSPPRRWNWEQLSKDYTRDEEARPYIERMKKQFEGVQTIRIEARTHFKDDLEGFSRGAVMKSVFFINLNPFEVYEKAEPDVDYASSSNKEVGELFKVFKVTTPDKQVLRITTLDGSETVTKMRHHTESNLLFHGRLPGIESTFASWDWYGASLGSRQGNLKRRFNQESGSEISMDYVEIENIVGKTVLCEMPEDASYSDPGVPGHLLSAEVVTWRLFQGFRSDRVLDWKVYRDGNVDVILPHNFETWWSPSINAEWKNLSITEFEKVDFNVPFPTSSIPEFLEIEEQ